MPRWMSIVLVLTALCLCSCSAFSPQSADLRPTYGFTPRAASSPAGGGYYEQTCGAHISEKDRRDRDCPTFYGQLPAVLDDADAARLRILKAELNDSGAPVLATMVALPVGAYALYRGIFGHGEEARKEIARLGLGGSALFGALKARESAPRQQIRLAAAEALSCVMYGGAARYLYEKRQITGQAAGDLTADGDTDGSPSLAGAQRQLRLDAQGLRSQLKALRVEIAVTPSTLERTGKIKSGCDTNSTSTTCKFRGEDKAPVILEDNAELRIIKAEAEEAEGALKAVGPLQSAANSLRTRIRNAPQELSFAIQRIESAANKAVQATEADVEALRKTVSGLKLGGQDLSGVLATAAKATGAASGAKDGAFQGQSGLVSTAKAQTQRSQVSKELSDARIRTREAYLSLLRSTEELQLFLDNDRDRLERVRALSDCQFVPPGLKLQVDPPGPVTLAPGSSVRFSALGGSELPTVAMIGATGLREDVLRREPDTNAGRQALSVVFTPDTAAADQDLRLVFRNGDQLVVEREISIRKSAGSKK